MGQDFRGKDKGPTQVSNPPGFRYASMYEVNDKYYYLSSFVPFFTNIEHLGVDRFHSYITNHKLHIKLCHSHYDFCNFIFVFAGHSLLKKNADSCRISV